MNVMNTTYWPSSNTKLSLSAYEATIVDYRRPPIILFHFQIHNYFTYQLSFLINKTLFSSFIIISVSFNYYYFFFILILAPAESVAIDACY